MYLLNRWFKDRRGRRVHVIRWEPETKRVIYMRERYPEECFSPLHKFMDLFTECGPPGEKQQRPEGRGD
ncbi:DUF4222 domain-containing protein [Salmonella enterica]|nr:DUF4222 domain-containing protein [Salmonella enterica subsp. diarizonae]EEG1121519.1 DUF4222 domain-containing protein [Salmonella enterica subsp. diarizonae]EGU4505589.1 DUF4222 domain-containing protein [Salmonella enterica]EKK4208798.1 DUF4222 domain-containing protein [Salmonella enterica]ELY5675696.1 DUF4222 domain-containing protein [Salmonella enterica]